MALTWLGAIPALMNGEHARRRRRRVHPAAARASGVHHRRRPPASCSSGHDLGVPVLGDAAELGHGDPASAPAHYRHHADDPIAITHSSGTTRMPAAVVHSHASLFAATRLVHLATPRTERTERTLCVLPAAHAAGIISHQQALCNRHELALPVGAGRSSWRAVHGSGAAVLDAIERWRPTGVFGFAVTWAELARFDLAGRDLSSVRAVVQHRRLRARGAHPPAGRGRQPPGDAPATGVVRVPGSKFIDGIGSTEMGHSAFQRRPPAGHATGTAAASASRTTSPRSCCSTWRPARRCRPAQVGHVGLKSPTLAPGYWNDSVTTYRTRFRGYYLTGDLMYRDDDGYYYHVDRAVDAVDLGDGNWLYTALSEERILARLPGRARLHGRRRPDRRQSRHRRPAAARRRRRCRPLTARRGPRRRGQGALGPAAAATLRRVVVVPDDDIVLGPTGKVRKFLMRQRHLQAAS